ncbi:uncharacterized protein LOC133745047 [Rosa rugosa]|uniref:uncharacterized protein LOC133745047 n=1 Tax=Rosa rugosa TaxID=74645 RepID=UPI002B413989|nr:uncharacterized protein LOC133745047 [Rosa rugosa]
MSNMNKLDFVPLDYAGKRYLFWVTDVEIHLIARDLLHTIQELCPIETAPDPQTEKDNSKALAFIKRHMDSDLQFEFINEDSAIKLWHALRERYGNVRDSILPNTEAEWKDLRFSEFDTVMLFYSEALRIKVMMRLCGKMITEDQLIEKTLNTFPACAMRSSDLFRTHVNARRITSFQQLIEAMATTERHGNELVQRRFDRLQDSYQEHRPMARESRHRRHDPYDRNAQEGNRSRRQSHDRRRRDFEGHRVGHHGANVGHGHHFPTPPVLGTMHIAPMRLNQGRILFMVSISDMERLINGPEFAMYLRR